MPASKAQGESIQPRQKMALIKTEPAEGLPGRAETWQWQQKIFALQQNFENQQTKQDLSIYLAHIERLSTVVDREMATNTNKRKDDRRLQSVGYKQEQAEGPQASMARRKR